MTTAPYEAAAVLNEQIEKQELGWNFDATTEAENAMLFAEATANYKDRLFAVLIEFATLDRFSVWKKADKLVLKHDVARHEGSYCDREFELSLVPKYYDDLYALEAAESDVREHYEAVAEEARLQAVRKAARAKLTDEEASALGLR